MQIDAWNSIGKLRIEIKSAHKQKETNNKMKQMKKKIAIW